MDPLRNYHALQQRVDALCRQIEDACREDLACRRGCDACCRHLTLFQVEGFALSLALSRLPAERVEAVRARARAATPEGPCPLLEGGLCALYEARPLICRTHGLPLLIVAQEEKRVDYCPENFKGRTSLPSSVLIDLERLNTALAAVEGLFLREVGKGGSSERITIAESLLLDAEGDEPGRGE